MPGAANGPQQEPSSTTDRLARLAQQRQRLAEQRARLAASRASTNSQAAPENAAPQRSSASANGQQAAPPSSSKASEGRKPEPAAAVPSQPRLEPQRGSQSGIGALATTSGEANGIPFAGPRTSSEIGGLFEGDASARLGDSSNGQPQASRDAPLAPEVPVGGISFGFSNHLGREVSGDAAGFFEDDGPAELQNQPNMVEERGGPVSNGEHSDASGVNPWQMSSDPHLPWHQHKASEAATSTAELDKTGNGAQLAWQPRESLDGPSGLSHSQPDYASQVAAQQPNSWVGGNPGEASAGRARSVAWQDETDDGTAFFSSDPPAGSVTHIVQAISDPSLQGFSYPESSGAAQVEVEQPSPFAANNLQSSSRFQVEDDKQGQAAWRSHDEAQTWGGQGYNSGPLYAQPRNEPTSANNFPAPSASSGMPYSWAPEPSMANDTQWLQQPSTTNGGWAGRQPDAQSGSNWSDPNGHQASHPYSESDRSIHGRPAVPLVAFGFGGRVIRMLPRPTPVMGSVQQLAVGPLEMLPTEQFVASVATLSRREALNYETAAYEDAEHLRRFPGVLAGSGSQKRVLDFLQGPGLGNGGDVFLGTASRSSQLLWATLRLLVQHKGLLIAPVETSSRSKDPSQSPSQQLRELLLGRQNGSLTATSLPGNGVQPNPDDYDLLKPEAVPLGTPEEAAQAMQAYLQDGNQDAALRTAIEANLWGPALLLAKLSGESAFRETAAAAAAAFLRQGSPLHTLLSTAGEDPALSTAGSQEAEGAGNWQGSLAILVANPGPSSSAGIARLGDRLWASERDVEAAHLCYLVAGIVPVPYEPSARLCLPGGDHRSNPRTFAGILPLQMGSILEYARQQGGSATPQSSVAALPYRLVLAAKLAEHGQIEAASQHCAVVTGALNALGGKLPPGLLVSRSLANELQLRLQHHAQAFNIHVTQSAGSLMSKAGRWLDKGLSRLIGAGDLPDGVQDATASKPPPPGQSHRRSASQPASPRAQLYRRVNSAGEISAEPGSRPGTPQEFPVPLPPSGTSAGSSPSQPGSTERAPSLSMRGLIGKVGSFTSLLGTNATPQKREAELGRENTLYFDTELKIWREHGKPPPEPEAPLPAPPTSVPAGQGSPVPASAPPPGSSLPAAPPGGVRSRYVDTIATSTSRQPSGGTVPRPPGPAGILPRPPTFFTPPGTASSPGAPAFFTPASAASNQFPGWSGGHRHSASNASTDSQQSLTGPPWGRSRSGGAPQTSRQGSAALGDGSH